MRWVLLSERCEIGITHLAPALSPLKGGEGDFLVRV